MHQATMSEIQSKVEKLNSQYRTSDIVSLSKDASVLGKKFDAALQKASKVWNKRHFILYFLLTTYYV